MLPSITAARYLPACEDSAHPVRHTPSEGSETQCPRRGPSGVSMVRTIVCIELHQTRGYRLALCNRRQPQADEAANDQPDRDEAAYVSRLVQKEDAEHGCAYSTGPGPHSITGANRQALESLG